jgi:hypothetical protein
MYKEENMKKFFIDTEFNGFGRDLISMAIVGENGEEFYEVVELRPDILIDSFVLEHVLPRTEKQPAQYSVFQDKLREFLIRYVSYDSMIIADWPDDISYFCKAMISSPGECICHLRLNMVVDHRLSSSQSKNLHNALEDARAIRDCYHHLLIK